MTAPRGARARSTAPWDVSFLRVGAVVTAGAAAVAALIAGVLGGWGSAAGVVAGALVVTAFFCVSGFVIARAGRIDDSLTLPAALGTFIIKLLVLVAILGFIPEDGWLDRRALAWTVIGAALLWSVVQGRWVWTRQLFYVTPTAPPAASSQVPQPDPEKPAPHA